MANPAGECPSPEFRFSIVGDNDKQGTNILEPARFDGIKELTVVHGDTGQPHLFQRKQVFLSLTEHQRPVFTTLNILDIENLKLLDRHGRITVPEKVLTAVGIDTASCITITVLLEIGIDNIAAVIANGHIAEYRLFDGALSEIVYDGIGQVVLERLDFLIDRLYGIIGLAQRIFLVRIKTGRQLGIELGQRRIPEREASGHTAIEAAKETVKKALGIDTHHQFRKAVQPLFRAERTVAQQRRFIQTAVIQVLFVKVVNSLGIVAHRMLAL